MDNTLFYNSFGFLLLSFKSFKHTNNSAGIKCHFIGRLRKGSGLIVTESGKKMHLCAGDVFYMPLGLRYNSYWSPDASADHTVEWESYRFEYFPSDSQKTYDLQIVRPDPSAEAILDRIASDMTVSVSSVGLFYCFLGSIMAQMETASPDPKDALLSRAEEYIKNHTPLRVPELARHCGMSESGLYAFFRTHARSTPIDMKNKIQAEKAVTLLRTTDASVEEISDRVGFQSVAYFRRIIKEQTGKTPSQIRKEWALLNYL
ncbi:MAG: helix-turn-helix transcriptional regulator [Clostridia bacterium]|nr:helix-turn-helix transcriptional regulator [Clostridia bacterium]